MATMSETLRVVKRESFAGPPITINVGQEEVKTFIVHEPILRKSSKFFDTLLSKDWKETIARVINLPDDNPEHVGIYVDWLYTNQIATMPAEIPDPADKNKKKSMSEKTTLAHLYCLGEKIQDNKFCNVILSTLIAMIDAPIGDHRWYFSLKFVKTIYNGTTRGSPARRFIVRIFIDRGDHSWIDDDDVENLCPDILFELARELMRGKPQTREPDLLASHSRRAEWYKEE